SKNRGFRARELSGAPEFRIRRHSEARRAYSNTSRRPVALHNCLSDHRSFVHSPWYSPLTPKQLDSHVWIHPLFLGISSCVQKGGLWSRALFSVAFFSRVFGFFVRYCFDTTRAPLLGSNHRINRPAMGLSDMVRSRKPGS